MVTFILHRTYVVWSWIIAAAVVVQVFLAGLYVFGSTSIEAHIINGSFLLFATLLGGIFALVARTPRRVAGASWVLFCLVVIEAPKRGGPVAAARAAAAPRAPVR
jgi:hypothetical protein